MKTGLLTHHNKTPLPIQGIDTTHSQLALHFYQVGRSSCQNMSQTVKSLQVATENVLVLFVSVRIVKKQRKNLCQWARFRVERASDEAVTIVLVTPYPAPPTPPTPPPPPDVKLNAVTDVITD